MTTLRFDLGSITIEGMEQTQADHFTFVKWDSRTKQHRLMAMHYRALLESLFEEDMSYDDLARAYEPINGELLSSIKPRDHQAAALKAWKKENSRATVCLPTGAGKTILAMLAIAEIKRSTLIIVPTIDLMQQWESVVKKFFGGDVGLLGGGHHDIKPITIATYDSGQMHIERYGNRFGFLVFDECHHLPGPLYQKIAICSLAPYRLGLSATLERSDGKESLIYDIVGPLAYEGQVQNMIGSGLSPYDVVTIEVPMNPEEHEQYLAARQIYTGFIRQNRINMSGPQGWQNFMFKASRSSEGKQAMKAFRLQKQLAQASANKLKELWEIIKHHAQDRMIIFTNDNNLAYRIGKLFILPVLTHQTKPKERKKMLEEFKKGSINILVTSKVLNEGVDVPEASVGVVVSGSAAIREHVQRLGRILRAQKGKTAVLYELVSEGTSEYFVNKRRKEHSAYQRSAH